MVKFSYKGDFEKTYKFLGRARDFKNFDFNRYGRKGVANLSSATPVRTGETARSWDYTITKGSNTITIIFTNSNIQNGVSIVYLLQYGHGTRTGGYVQGQDFINPAIQPVFDEIINDAWKEVTKD